LKYARDVLCPELGVVIPAATPHDGWRYQVTTEWAPVEEGATWALGLVESRLRNLARDVAILKPHLDRGTKPWRRANFLDKRLALMLQTLEDIDNG
jgi:hypothetical protein